ncbi:MAG: nitroreductase [Cytophagaceae bacterium]|nr:nitroreductase [Cytophagaceae bacterium]
MKNLFNLIKHRRSIFPEQYLDEPIEKEIIHKLLEAANWAPTHKRTEPWRFKIFMDASRDSLSDAFAEAYKKVTPEDKFSDFKMKNLTSKPKLSGAVIAICMLRDPKESLPEWEEVASVAMAVQNMWLMASSLDLGSYWSSPGLMSEMSEFLNLAEGEKCLGFFYLGYYDIEKPEGKRGAIDEKVEWR